MEVHARHKLAPGLVFASEEQGGLGLQNIELALQVTRINQAEQWIQRPLDNYHAAWHSLAHPQLPMSRDCCAFTPTSRAQVRQAQTNSRSKKLRTVQELGRLELWADQTEQLKYAEQVSDRQARIHELKETIICLWAHDNTIKCILNWDKDDAKDSTIVTDYWRTSKWDNNSCIVDHQGKPLRKQDYPLFQSCTLMKLRVRLESPGVYNLSPPRGDRSFTVRHYKNIRRWCVSIFACVPPSVWTAELSSIRSRKFPSLANQYSWQTDLDNSVIGVAPIYPDYPALRLEQEERGWTWKIKDGHPDKRFDKDVQILESVQNVDGLAFECSPYLHPTPWSASVQCKSNSVRSSICIKRKPQLSIKHVLDKMDMEASQHGWARAAQTQRPKDIWNHDGVLTDYQKWTIYRICTRSMNLYHAGWPENRQCSYQHCNTSLETIEHIIWECARAKQVWQEWIPQWTGHHLHRDELSEMVTFLASRNAPQPSPMFMVEATKSIPIWEKGHDDAMNTIWLIWTTCTQSTLWLIRNREIFDGEEISISEARRSLRKLANYQTQAVIRGKSSRPSTYDQGIKIAECYAVFKAIRPSDRPTAVQRWNILIHSVKLPESQERDGLWVIAHSSSKEVISTGILRKKLPIKEEETAFQLLTTALAQLKQKTVTSTTQLEIEGNCHVIKTLSKQPRVFKCSADLAAIVWKPSSKAMLKVVKAVLKTQRDSEHQIADNQSGIHPQLIERLQQQIIKDQNGSPMFYRNSIRQSLQRYQDSIV